MYRRCILCSWGRKECIESIKFYKIPDNPGLQKLQWMQVLSAHGYGDKFKKIDSICSVHFVSGKPSNNPKDVNFVPTLYLNEKELTEEFKKKYLRKYTDDEEKVKTERVKRLTKLKERMHHMKEITAESKAEWVERVKAKRRQRGLDENTIISKPLCCSTDPSSQEEFIKEADAKELSPSAAKKKKIEAIPEIKYIREEVVENEAIYEEIPEGEYVEEIIYEEEPIYALPNTSSDHSERVYYSSRDLTTQDYYIEHDGIEDCEIDVVTVDSKMPLYPVRTLHRSQVANQTKYPHISVQNEYYFPGQSFVKRIYPSH